MRGNPKGGSKKNEKISNDPKYSECNSKKDARKGRRTEKHLTSVKTSQSLVKTYFQQLEKQKEKGVAQRCKGKQLGDTCKKHLEQRSGLQKSQ